MLCLYWDTGTAMLTQLRTEAVRRPPWPVVRASTIIRVIVRDIQEIGHYLLAA
jgi:hypothetical protein